MTTTSPKTQKVLKWFEQIAGIPRCSKHEEKIRQWLLDWGAENSFETRSDAAGNVLIKVPGTAGYEDSPIVVIQGHMDMVCEKTPDSPHDFETDPIELVYDGEWLRANKTTLGADNGIAIALALAMVMDEEVEHPPLELLFTVDEETGLTGANELQPGFIDGKILLNVDSEEEGVFTVGCAGGKDTLVSLPLQFEPAPKGASCHLLKVGGLRGGHSGVDIHEQRGNAIQVLARTLAKIMDKAEVRLGGIDGGSAHNAIPRDAQAHILLAPADADTVKTAVAAAEKMFKAEFGEVEPGLAVAIEKCDCEGDASLTADSAAKAIQLLLAFPHGVFRMDSKIQGLVETSNNLATVKTGEGSLEVLSSQRSSVVSRLEELTAKLHAVAELAGGGAHTGVGYPPWEANWDSRLLTRCKKVYKGKFGKEPVIEVIHAGLECGIIGDRNPGMDMISFGPTIRNPHSPDECLKVSDIDKIWDFVAELFKDSK